LKLTCIEDNRNGINPSAARPDGIPGRKRRSAVGVMELEGHRKTRSAVIGGFSKPLT
jgi:hypothetical protein